MTGSISLATALVAGRNRVPTPPTGNTALRTGSTISAPQKSVHTAVSRTEQRTRSVSGAPERRVCRRAPMLCHSGGDQRKPEHHPAKRFHLAGWCSGA